MNSSSINKLLITSLAGLCLSLLAEAQTVSARHQMTPEVEQAIGKMRAMQSNAEVVQALKAIPDRSEQATQVILASMNVLDLAQRNAIIAMLFQLLEADDGLNASHFPLLIQLYVKTALSPPFSLEVVHSRSFIQNETLNFRLVILIASFLHAESPFVTRFTGKSMPRLLKLLESTRGSSSLSAADHQMVEDAIIVVKKGIEEDGLKDMTPIPAIPPSNLSVVPPPAPAKVLEHKSTASPLAIEPLSSPPWSYIILLVIVAIGLLWWNKSRK